MTVGLLFAELFTIEKGSRFFAPPCTCNIDARAPILYGVYAMAKIGRERAGRKIHISGFFGSDEKPRNRATALPI